MVRLGHRPVQLTLKRNEATRPLTFIRHFDHCIQYFFYLYKIFKNYSKINKTTCKETEIKVLTLPSKLNIVLSDKLFYRQINIRRILGIERENHFFLFKKINLITNTTIRDKLLKVSNAENMKNNRKQNCACNQRCNFSN